MLDTWRSRDRSAQTRRPFRLAVAGEDRDDAGQTLRCASGESSSLGGPLRALTEASLIGRARIEVAFNSFASGLRTSSQRPGTSLLVRASSAARRSAAAIAANLPSNITER